jgi:hypothetical protein
MKKISIYFASLALVLMAGACSTYLDINENPNQATSVTPDLILPQALVATAINLNGYNNYGAQIGGYMANAGGYGGFNELVTYRYTSSNYGGLWSSTYDNLEDYQYIINSTTGISKYNIYNGIALIMRAFNYQLLVDTYNDVPYSNALKGSGNLTPSYDKGSDIYKDLAVQLDTAIARINRGASTSGTLIPTAADVMFHGTSSNPSASITKWLQFANTLKLRIMIRGNGKVTFANSNFDPAGFLATDALVNPGYSRDNNKQNPAWNTWVFSYSGAAGNKAWMPTTWMMSFYNGGNLTDHDRGNAIYYNFTRTQYPTTPSKTKIVYGDSISNQLGHEGNDTPACPTGSAWYSGTDRGGKTAGNWIGVLKDPGAGVMVISAAESYFLQAEAAVIGLPVTGAALPSADVAYQNGVTASFTYLYSDKTNTPTVSASAIATMVSNYYANNAGDHRADWTAANTPDKQVEAIITQKYIALNMINSQEGWNEYRRTGYPLISGTGATTTFASSASQSTRADRLPARIVYPVSESAYNAANVPQGITVFGSTIFWAK